MNKGILKRTTALLTSIFMLILVIAGAFLSAPVSAETDSGFAGGSGISGDPFQVSTAKQLDKLRDYLGDTNRDKHFQLVNNIDLEEYIEANWTNEGWQPIGDVNDGFCGKLDGQNYTISGLWIERETELRIGLFGYIFQASLYSLRVEIPEEKSVNGNISTGGLVGYKSAGLIENCSVSGPVTGTNGVGGLVGNNTGTIQTNYATGSVSGSNYVGGLIGYQENRSIQSSYATGSVSGSSYIGGLVGYNRNGTVTNNYRYEGTTVNGSYVADSDQNGTALPASKLWSKQTYMDNGWDFDTVWEWDADYCYPKLRGIPAGVQSYPFDFYFDVSPYSGEQEKGVLTITPHPKLTETAWTASPDQNTPPDSSAYHPLPEQQKVGLLTEHTTLFLKGTMDGQEVKQSVHSYHIKASGGHTLTAKTENGKVEGAGEKQVGTVVTLKAVPEEGYRFTGWESSDITIPDGKKNQDTLTFSMPDHDVTVTARMEKLVQSVQITPSSASVQKGKTRQFRADVTAASDIDNSAEWTVSGNTSTGTAITADGLLTVGADETAGELTVTAKATADRNETGSVTVKVLGNEHKNHEWSDWRTVKEATTKQTGLEQRTCTVCGETETREIPKRKDDGSSKPDDSSEPEGNVPATGDALPIIPLAGFVLTGTGIILLMRKLKQET